MKILMNIMNAFVHFSISIILTGSCACFIINSPLTWTSFCASNADGSLLRSTDISIYSPFQIFSLTDFGTCKDNSSWALARGIDTLDSNAVEMGIPAVIGVRGTPGWSGCKSAEVWTGMVCVSCGTASCGGTVWTALLDVDSGLSASANWLDCCPLAYGDEDILFDLRFGGIPFAKGTIYLYPYTQINETGRTDYQPSCIELWNNN